jgi:hypothetical protein
MTREARKAKKSYPPVLGVALLALMLIIAYVVVAIGSVAPVNFIYDGI